MARTRTNWHLADLDVDEGDPFLIVENIGTQLDLTADLDRIHAQLAETLQQETALDAAGMKCAIKENPQACCSACPVRHLGHDDPMSALCSIGVEQERLLTRVAMARASVIE